MKFYLDYRAHFYVISSFLGHWPFKSQLFGQPQILTPVSPNWLELHIISFCSTSTLLRMCQQMPARKEQTQTWGSPEWDFLLPRIWPLNVWLLWLLSNVFGEDFFFLFLAYFICHCFQREGRVSLPKPLQRIRSSTSLLQNLRTSQCDRYNYPHFTDEELGHLGFKLFRKKNHRNSTAQSHFKCHVLSNRLLIPHHQLSLGNISNKRTQLQNEDEARFICARSPPPTRTGLFPPLLLPSPTIQSQFIFLKWETTE